jgi:hypothetical protein
MLMLLIYSALGIWLERLSSLATQPAHAPNAAPRRQDRGDFGIQMRSDVVPIYRCGAADGQAVSLPCMTAQSVTSRDCGSRDWLRGRDPQIFDRLLASSPCY